MVFLKIVRLSFFEILTLLVLNGCGSATLSCDPLSEDRCVKDAIEQYYSGNMDLYQKDIPSHVMLSKLDKYSKIIEQREYDTFMMKTTGEYNGFGIMLTRKEKMLIVFQVMEGSPAKKAGLAQGDITVSIDGLNTNTLAMKEIAKTVKDQKRDKILLRIIKANSSRAFDIILQKNTIKIESVKTKLLLDGILHIRISTFDQNVASLMERSLQREEGYKGIILDLRDNGGGLLREAVDIADMFLDDGIIVSRESRHKENNEVFKAESDSTITNVPMVVLINNRSASASEVVAGALQDHNRAVIVGEKSYGKGTVQDTIRLGKRKLLKLTVANYYLPNGRSIESQGITPQYTITQDDNRMNMVEGFAGDRQLKVAFDIVKKLLDNL